MKSLEELGWTDALEASFHEVGRRREEPVFTGRIAADFGMQCDILDGKELFRAEISGRLRFDLDDPLDAPAVGDWVVLRKEEGALATIIEVLPRKSQLVRQAPGKRPMPQVVGANLDLVFVVTSLNLDFNLRRLERYITAILDGGIRPVVVLNKADLVSEERRKSFREEAIELGPEVAIIETIALERAGIEEIRALIDPGLTAAFVGSSGVGKSTLVNGLYGSEILATKEVRIQDDRGRHTTTHRQLIMLPSRGLVMDTPGMREFHVWGAEEGLEDAFEDIAALAENCRFRDCSHENEPGCAVLAALEEGTITAQRLASYRKLRGEAKEREERKAESQALIERRRRKKRKK